MSAMASGNPGRALAGRARIRLAASEILGTAAIMVAYFLLRGIRPPDAEGSVMRSLAVIRFEQQIGIFQEVRWQAMFLPHQNLMAIANWVYAWGHYPVMLVIALWLVVKDPARFRFIRNVLLLSATVGVISYWLLPAAPPRLMEIHGYDFGFQDTVHGAQSTVSYFQPGPFVNDYAALPSFHFGWILLSSLAIWANTVDRYARAGAIAMSAVMWWAVTVTGNHYFFDMVFGGLVVVLAWLAVDALGRRRASPWAPSSGGA
ncbi:MAG: hypothetical protein C0506_12265 [Anaerolinea sp.]|nr:hypothetical protein [Anaerolinea sp.]